MILNDKKIILWDFDGVILNSNTIRNLGFSLVLEAFPEEQVEQLLQYHKKNGGLSRYNKLQYFFEVIRDETVTIDLILEYANKFSRIMLDRLQDETLLIQDSISFIRNNFEKKCMHVVSASDQKELKTICQSLQIDHYFNSILGSPTPKIENVASILAANNYHTKDVVLIGDSINDFDAAKANNISFIGYNNLDLEPRVPNYVHSLLELAID